MSNWRIIHRVEPYPHEDIEGFLMRVAARNRASGPGELLARVTGSPTTSVRVDDAQALAHYFRLTTIEASGLSGIVRRGTGQAFAWQIGGEWVTKSAFVAPHRAKVCPRCLAEHGYIRGIWNLTLYTVCAEHRLRLVTHCPSCGKALKWDRRRLDRCGCGCDLTQAPHTSMEGPAAWLAWLIARRTEATCPVSPAEMDVACMDNLLDLSLDGLMKLVWFLGHCIGDLDHCHVSHGHVQPEIDDAQRITGRAFALLHEWPRCLADELSVQSRRTVPHTSASLLNRVFGPAQYFLHEEMQTAELARFAHTYEQIVLDLWHTAGHRCRSLEGCRQIPLEFA